MGKDRTSLMLPYTYVPGRTPHPMSHPDGHRFQGRQLDATDFEMDRWQACDAYNYAVELFDHGYYWEAHEVWEGCWNAAGRTGTTADFLKALIKLSAALVKAREGRAEGVRRHAARAQELLRHVEPTRASTIWCGLNIKHLIEMASTIKTASDRLVAEAGQQSTEIVTPFAGLRLVDNATGENRGDS